MIISLLFLDGRGGREAVGAGEDGVGKVVYDPLIQHQSHKSPSSQRRLGSRFMLRHLLDIAPVFRLKQLYELGSSLRWNDDFWVSLSPPPAPARIIHPFRSHGRRELSHSRRSGAWSSSGRRFDTPSAGVAIGEEGGTKLDRPIHSGFETGAARRPTKSPRVGRHGCPLNLQQLRHPPASHTPPMAR